MIKELGQCKKCGQTVTYCDCEPPIPDLIPTLAQIYDTVRIGDWPDKGTTHSYIDFYDQLFSPVRASAKNVLEIGIFKGLSLIMWEEYFYNATVYGVDCDEQPHGGMADLRTMIQSGKHNIRIMDATNAFHAEREFTSVRFDVVIDDAAHNLEQQLSIYNVFKQYMAPGGIYVIEDVQDIDRNRHFFQAIDSKKSVEIIDRRNIKNRYDDVLVVIRDK